MSEDKTQDIEQRYGTKPTIETLVQMISDAREETRSFRASVEKRFDSLDVRLDRIESAVHETKSNFHALRADFNEMRNALRENFQNIP